MNNALKSIVSAAVVVGAVVCGMAALVEVLPSPAAVTMPEEYGPFLPEPPQSKTGRLEWDGCNGATGYVVRAEYPSLASLGLESVVQTNVIGTNARLRGYVGTNLFYVYAVFTNGLSSTSALAVALSVSNYGRMLLETRDTATGSWSAPVWLKNVELAGFSKQYRLRLTATNEWRVAP